MSTGIKLFIVLLISGIVLFAAHRPVGPVHFTELERPDAPVGFGSVGYLDVRPDTHVLQIFTPPLTESEVLDYDDVASQYFVDSDRVSLFIRPKGQRDSLQCLLITGDTINTLHFFWFNNGHWDSAGSFNSNGRWFESADMNFDHVEDIITTTPYNMNGNKFKEIYIYNTQAHKMMYAGKLAGYILLDTAQKFIREEYTGSWYMPNSETEYDWVANRLHMRRMLTSYFEGIADMDSSETISYYVSESKDSDKLREIWHGRQPTDADKYDSLWEHFFELH